MQQIKQRLLVCTALTNEQRTSTERWLRHHFDEFTFMDRQGGFRVLDADGGDSGLNQRQRLFDAYKLFQYVLVDLCTGQFGIVSAREPAEAAPLHPDSIILTNELHLMIIRQLCSIVSAIDSELEIACSLMMHSNALPRFRTTDEFKSILGEA